MRATARFVGGRPLFVDNNIAHIPTTYVPYYIPHYGLYFIMTALQSESTLSSKDYSSPSVYSCASAQSLSSHWANYQLCIPPVNSFFTSDNDSFRISSSVSLPSIGVLIKTGFLVDNLSDDCMDSDDTPQTDTLQHTDTIPKSEDSSQTQNSSLTVIPAVNPDACLPQTKPKAKIGMSLSASTIWTDILDFSCSLSSFPTSFLFGSWDNTGPVSKARLSGLVSAFPSSQALGSTASCSTSKLVRSDLLPQRSLAQSTNIPAMDTVTSRLSAAAVPPFSTTELKNTCSSTALNIVKKAKSNLKLITSRSLRNLAKINLKVSRTPDTIKSNKAKSETTPRSLIPPIVSITTQSSRFSSWFSASGADLCTSSAKTEADVCYNLGPSMPVFPDDLTRRGTTSNEPPGLDPCLPGNDNQEQQGVTECSNLCAPDIQASAFEKHRLRQNARTLRGLRREQIAAAQSYPALENDFEMYSLVSQFQRLFLSSDNEESARGSSEDAIEDGRHVLSRCPNNTPVKMVTHSDDCALACVSGLAEVNGETAQLHIPSSLAPTSGVVNTVSTDNAIEEDKASSGNATKIKKRRIWERLRLGSPAFKKDPKTPGTRGSHEKSDPNGETKEYIKMELKTPPSGEERTKLYYDVAIERGRRRYERYLSKAKKFTSVSSRSEMAC